MTIAPDAASALVRTLVPSLSRSLAEQFNVFRVMHHGTHEKQLSNVFAWLLTPEGTHELGDAAQRIFLDHVNASLPDGARLPGTGYRVAQEVDTRGESGGRGGADIADIVLTRTDAAVVVENFSTSDGHGHDYRGYHAHAAAGERASAVVLLCQRRETHRQRDDWEQAVVITYEEILRDVHEHVAGQSAWRRDHPDQHVFVRQLYEHFVEGPTAVNLEDTLAFLKAMCDTGESARYGQRPRDLITREFADLLAEHAKRQFEDSRKALAATKSALRSYARSVLVDQVNAEIGTGRIESVAANWVGRWEWCVQLKRAAPHPTVYLEFGPTAVARQETAPDPVVEPDYSRVFVSRRDAQRGGAVVLRQTDVTLAEAIAGLSPDDVRLRDAVLSEAAEEPR